MKKLLIAALAAATIAMAVPSVQAEAVPGRGGCVGGLVGCCFGIRTAAAWNEGKNINIREWLQFLYVGYIWAGIEGYSGVTTTDLQSTDPGYF
jgi:hypothetical protein